MKILYFLSGLAIFNLLAVSVLANSPAQIKDTPIVAGIATIVSTPTPIIVIKQVVKKVTKFATNAPNTNVLTTNTLAQATTQNLSNTQPTVTQPPAPAAVPISGCIITIDGGSYDITNFRNQHSGGNIFSCGSDMSSSFWGKHGQSQFNKMQQYRI